MSVRTPRSPRTFESSDDTNKQHQMERRLDRMMTTIDKLGDIVMEFEDSFWYRRELNSVKNDIYTLLEFENIDKDQIKVFRNRLHLIAKKIAKEYNNIHSINNNINDSSDDNIDNSYDSESSKSSSRSSISSNNSNNSTICDPYSDNDDEARKKLEKINEEYRIYTVNQYFDIIKNNPNITLENAILIFEKVENKNITLDQFAERKGRKKNTYIDAFKEHYQNAKQLYAKNMFIKQLENPGWI